MKRRYFESWCGQLFFSFDFLTTEGWFAFIKEVKNIQAIKVK